MATASSPGPLTAAPPGARVRVRARVWSVVARTPFSDCDVVRLACAGAPGETTSRTVLAPFDRVERLDVEAPICLRRPRRWLHTVHQRLARAHPFGGLITAATAAIDILPYQLEPVLAVLHGTTRLMIADAVGLGKTIQAGLILAELAARGESLRALVAVPAGLRHQWAEELARHFGLGSIVADAGWLARMSRDLPPGVNPWVLPAVYIASFDFLKRPEVLRPLEDIAWDAVVVDEAHNAASGTARRAAIDAAAVRARRVVLLTATPHSGDTGQFEDLCRLGAPPGDDAPILLFRRTRDVAGSARRKSVMLTVRLSPSERRMHRLLAAYTDRVCREAGARPDAPARLAAIVLRKRALSSAASLAVSVSRRLELLSGAPPHVEQQLPLPLGEDDAVSDCVTDAVLASPGLADPVLERQLLQRIAAAAEASANGESKTRFLVRLLRRAGEPVIVFTEYRDTLVRLGRILGSAGFRPLMLHGEQPPAERAAVQAAFNVAGALLVATDAAAEGLNLQARCRAVVHYELPWSPARLEQRTGRVDRIGQRRRVHEILLVARDTAERLVLAPLVSRAHRARAAIASGPGALDLLTETGVARAVLEGMPIPATTASPLPRGHVPPGDDLVSAAAAEGLRVVAVRRWPSVVEAPGTRTMVVSRARGRCACAVALYEARLMSADGGIAHAELIAVRDHLAAVPGDRTCRAARRSAEAWMLEREPAARAVLLEQLRPSVSAARAANARAARALEDREWRISAAPRSAARELVQAGLFDARAVRAMRHRQQAAGELIRDSERRRGALATSSDLTLDVRVVGLLWCAPS